MQKLVEREAAPRSRPFVAPALAVQFFLIPLAVVAVMVTVYVGFRALLDDSRTAEDYLNDIRSGGRERRWPAAFELSRLLADPEVQRREPGLGPAVVRAFEEARGDDPRIRRYLALAIGRLDPPPEGASAALLAAVDDADTETAITAIWALGSLGEVAALPRLQELYASSDPEIRKVVVYVLGALPGDAQVSTLAGALDDPVPDVQWNAAVGLARHGDERALPVLRRLLDRAYLERTVTAGSSVDPTADRVSEIMVNGLRSVAALKDASARASIVELSRTDRSMKVRQAAIEALEALDDPERGP
jgi:HEAT repeat protein